MTGAEAMLRAVDLAMERELGTPPIYTGPAPINPRETERQADQRIADELRARNYANACRDPIRQLGDDEE